jgi:transposase
MTCLAITSERIDDVPLLIYWLLQMHIDKIIDAVLGPPHGNRQGLSYGQQAVVFIAYILTECNHFLSPVRDWALERRECLSQALGCPIRDTDFTDDRLEDLLDAVGAVETREQIEMQLGQHLIRAYALPTDTGRIDTTSVSVYHQPDGESLLSYGQSKDHRPDLRQFKEALGTLDPAGLPLCSATVGGQCADDPLYLPVWRRMAAVIGHTNFLVVGDCKMAGLETRAQIQREKGFYLAPLPLTGDTPDDLRRWVFAPTATPVDIYLPQSAPDDPPVGRGFEVNVARTGTDPQTGERVTWRERVLIVRSDKLARRQQRGLAQRLLRAEKALRKVKPAPDADSVSLTIQSQTLLERHNVGDYLQVAWMPHTTQTKRYLKRGRHGPDTPFEIVTTTNWQLAVEHQTEAIETFNRLAGWRLYVTNTPAQRLDLSGAVACYREQWQPERGFHRLKGVPLAIRPLLLRSDLRISGLLCILVIALRALTLFEFVARRSLEQQPEPLQGVYAGNPKRTTTRPTTERLLKAFDEITLYRLDDGNSIRYQVTPLSALQRQILALVGIPESAYTGLGNPLLSSP